MAGRINPRRTQAERRSESEEALLAAATELVAERGIDRASLASIGERAGASRGLPTHHFGSKDGLVARLAQRAQDRIFAAMSAAVAQLQGDPDDVVALELIRLSVDTYLALFEHPSPEGRALIVMWGATFPAESSIEGMLEADTRGYEGWAGHITNGQRDGSIRRDIDPTAGAVLLLGMLRGVAALLITESDVTDMRRVRETCQTWVTAALASPTAAPSPATAKRSSRGLRAKRSARR